MGAIMAEANFSPVADVMSYTEGARVISVSRHTSFQPDLAPESIIGEIPELPSGHLLRVDLLSNWGDATYVGLNAIEIFTDSGKRSEVAKISSNASRSVGSVESIFVESFACTDQGKMWRAEMGPDRCVSIEIEFVQLTRIAMIRFWVGLTRIEPLAH
ncbi:hypothetical protein OSTOST_01864 [Ostertagia ostertagi]